MTTEPKDSAGTAAPASEFHPDTYPLRVQLLAAWRAWFDWRREKPADCTWNNPTRGQLGQAISEATEAYESALVRSGMSCGMAHAEVLKVEEFAFKERDKAHRAFVPEADTELANLKPIGPRPLFPMDRVQVITDNKGRFFVSFNGDNGVGPFRTEEDANAYAARQPRGVAL